jgi:hypothetical protein
MIQNNLAQGGTNNDGGGIRSVGNLTISDSTISGNSALRDGGGIFHSSGNFSVSRSTIISNAAGRDGGAIRSSASSLTMSDSTVSGNRANGGDGGGIWRSGSLTVTNSTLDGNIAFSSGGGLHLFGTGTNTFTIRHSTIAANSASSSSGFGGGAFVVGGALILDHTILATNTASVGPDLTRLIDAVVNLRFSLIGNSANSGLAEAPVGSPDANGNLIGGPVKGTINPLLGPLANYGGPTQTRFLKRGSPALDAGDPSAEVGPGAVPAFDQRGEPFERIFDGDGEGGTRIDIGAYENRPLTFVVDTLADESNSDYSVGDFALREAISLGNGSSNPEDDIIKFANALTTGGPATIVLTHGELAVTDSMRIIGPGADLLTIDANDPTPDEKNGDGSRVFNIDNGNTSNDKGVSLYGLMLTGGDIGGIGKGGAIRSMEDLTVTKSTISGNATGGIVTDNYALSGGGIYSAGNLTIAASTISHNSARDRGGGILAFRGTVLVTDSTISDNSAGFIGGGISTADAVTSVTIVNSTISGNSAHATWLGGGGILANNNGTVTVIGSTISTNTALAGGGILINDGVLTVGHTIIAGNGNNDVYDRSFRPSRSALASLGYNLIGTGNAFPGTSNPLQAFNQPGDQTGVDPLLGPLADNGGPTMTHALLPGSPAIDAGDPNIAAGVGSVSEFDQRGSPFRRVLDGDATGGGRIDIGAFESAIIPDPSPVPWQNPAKAQDVNGNGMVSPVDALIVINELLISGPHVLPASKPEGTPPYFLDVSGNGRVSSQDVLMVVNFLLSASIVASASPAQASGNYAPAVSSNVHDAATADLVMARAAASVPQSETATLTIAASTPDFPAAIATVTPPQTTSLLLSVASALARPPQFLVATTVTDSIDSDDPTIPAARNQVLPMLLRQTDKDGADFALEASPLREIDNAFADDSFIDELLVIGWEDCR